MIYLSKLLPIFVLPVGVTLLLIAAGLVKRWPRVIWAGFVLLWLSATPWVSGRVMRSVEGHVERMPASEAPVVDAIVVLSVGRTTAPGKTAVSEWTDANRFFGGVELFQAGKAPVLVFTGGALGDASPLEGDILAGYARALGVAADRVLVTGRVFNTAGEARAVADLLRPRQAAASRVLLVTSAFHMARARYLFERAGLVVTAFPVDFRGTVAGGFSLMALLPTAGALQETQLAIRELYGQMFYRLGFA